ncbi:MAG: DMT family transporter [Burkholderiaceae bacterium]
MSQPATPVADSGVATGILLVFMTVLIWGAQFPIAKSTFQHVDPFHTALVRYGLPCAILLGLLVMREGVGAMRFDSQARRATVFDSSACGSPSLVFGGLQFARLEIAAIIVAVQPSITAVVLWVMRGRRPDAVSLVCIGFAFLGVITVVTRWSVSLAPSGLELIGDLMILAGAVCWVVYTISGESFRHWSILRFTALTMLPGTIGHVLVATTLILMGVIHTPSAQDFWAARVELLYLSILGVLVSMLTWNAGTKRIGPLNAMLFLNLIPVVAFGIRYWQGYRFETVELVGAAMVIAALVANNLVLRRRARAVA